MPDGTSEGTSRDRVSAELAAIRERFDSLAARYPLAEMAAPDRDGLKTHGGHIATSVLDVPRLLAAVEAARKVHAAVPIYEIALHGHASSPVDGGFILHCGHPDTALDDDRHAESDEGDWICLDQLVHTACEGCRDDEGELADFANCATRAAITAALLGQDAPSVTGEDSSDD